MLHSWKFFPTARALIDYFEVITSNRMKLFLAKISERATKSMMSGGNSALLPANVDRRPTLGQSLTNSQLQNFQLYNKSRKDWSFGETVNFISLESQSFPWFRLGKHQILGKQY